ncbi:muscle M-line assembly protein unc-89-like isoform X2 [Saccostrea cucullata]|uniref:muscle M-line assembly protein unc-89-like isoform X2 n=1 Tax=Saccostrea cuccullata TaxID=36930 RepID=UPI002ED1A822
MSVVKAGVLEGSSDSEEEVHVYKLKIHDTDVKDAGEWRVEVADRYGSTSTSCNLAILDDPKPKPSVTYAGKVGKGDKSDDEEVHLYKLRIHDAQATDAGRWRCEVEDKYGSTSSSCNLLLDPYNLPSRPKFVTFLRDQQVEEGFCVKFQCIVTGNPIPRIEWYRDLEPIGKSSFVHTAYRGDGTAFLQLFSPVADRDSGTYRCVARNSEGSSFTEALLTIRKQITNADLRDQFSISRARTRNEELASFTGHHLSKFEAAERMMLKSDQYTFETSPHLKKSELYHLDSQFKGHRKSNLYSALDIRRQKKYESPGYEDNNTDRMNIYNVENDYKPRKRYDDEDLKGKTSKYELENEYKNKNTDLFTTDYKYGTKNDLLQEMELQRKLESKKIFDSLTKRKPLDKGIEKSSGVEDFSYKPKSSRRRTAFSDEINPGLSKKAIELTRSCSVGTGVDLRRSKSVSLSRDVSSRLILDDKKGYYTLRPRPKSVAMTYDFSKYESRPKSASVTRDFASKSGYDSDREESFRSPRTRPKSASFSRDLDSPRRTRSASLARDISVTSDRKLDEDKVLGKRDTRARSLSVSRDTEELIRSVRESSVGKSEFADIEAYRAELHNKQKADKSSKTTCKRKQHRKDIKYQTLTRHFADENKPIKEINPGLSLKAREIVNRQGYRYKVDRDLLNISMSRGKQSSRPSEDTGDEEPVLNEYKKPEKNEPNTDGEEMLSDEAFKRKMYLKNLDQFINRANNSFYDMEDSEVPSWRKEKLQDTGFDYTKHRARKNKIELFDFDDIRTSKLPARRQQPKRAQSVGPELETKNKMLNSMYDKERQALLKLGTNWVQDKPLSFIERLKSKSSLEGNSVLLSCFVTGKEPFVVLWYRRGIALSRDEEENFQIRSNGGFLSLEIPVTSTYDTGEYMVEVRNEEGKIKSNCYLQVEPVFDPRVDYKHPEFIEPIHYVHVKKGQAATFSCKVKGTPAPFVRWFKDGIELQHTDRIDIHQGEKGQAFLLIHDTEECDTGLYKCEAQSMAGRCRSIAKLQVLDSMADACDEVSCNIEVERIISRTKDAKGIVSDVPIQKPRAWRAGVDSTESIEQQKDNVTTEKADAIKETPLKSSEILTVLDETLKAGNVAQSTEVDINQTSPDKSLSKPESFESKLTIPLSHDQSLFSLTPVTINVDTSSIPLVERSLLTDVTNDSNKQAPVDISVPKSEQTQSLAEADQQIKRESKQLMAANAENVKYNTPSETDSVTVYEVQSDSNVVQIPSTNVSSTEVEHQIDYTLPSEIDIKSLEHDSGTDKIEKASETSVSEREVSVNSEKSLEDASVKSDVHGKGPDAISLDEKASETFADVSKPSQEGVDRIDTDAKEKARSNIEQIPFEDASLKSVVHGKGPDATSMDEKVSETFADASKSSQEDVDRIYTDAKEKTRSNIEQIPLENASVKSDVHGKGPDAISLDEKVSETFADASKPTQAGIDRIDDDAKEETRSNTGQIPLQDALLKSDVHGKGPLSMYDSVSETFANISKLSQEGVDRIDNDAKEEARSNTEEMPFTKTTSKNKMNRSMKGSYEVLGVDNTEDRVDIEMQMDISEKQEPAKLTANDIKPVSTVDTAHSEGFQITSSVASTVSGPMEETVKAHPAVQMGPAVHENIENIFAKSDDAHISLSMSPESENVESLTTPFDLSHAQSSDKYSLSSEQRAQEDTTLHTEHSTNKTDDQSLCTEVTQDILNAKQETEFKANERDDSMYSDISSAKDFSLSVPAQRVSSPIEKKVKTSEVEGIEKPASPSITPIVQKSEKEESKTDVIDGQKAVSEETTPPEIKESVEKIEKVQEKVDAEKPAAEVEKVDVEKALEEEGQAPAVAEKSQEEKEKTDLREEQKETETKEASETVKEPVETQEAAPKEEEREPQPPTFVKNLPNKLDLKDGDDLLLQCITDGLPKPEVIWMHENKPIEASENIFIKDSHDVHALEIKKVNHKVNSGVYMAKLVGGSSSGEQEEVVSRCKVSILTTASIEESTGPDEEDIKERDLLPLVEKQISTEQEELKLQIPPSVDLQEVCEEGQSDADKMHIPMVSPTGVHCHSSPLDKAEKEEELPASQTSPHFSQALDEELYPLERDENVRIQCVVAGEPCPKIVWFKDGVKLEQSSRVRLEWDPDTRIASVLLKRLHILDTGEYECIVYGENGSYSTKTTLHVKALEMQKVETIDRDEPPENVPPKFFLSLKDKKVFQGKGTSLDCVVKGNPEPEVKWLRHGKEIVSRHGKYKITNLNQQHSLTIEDFKKSDEGCYTVEATSESGCCSSSAYLTMEAVVEEVDTAKLENSAPEFTSKMEGIMAPVGGVVTFKCSASGYPVPKFKWQKDMLDLYQSKRITIDNVPGETTLTINDVSRRDGGMYVCVAKNTLGRSKQTAKLIVSEDCKETRRLSISGEVDKSEEPAIPQSESTDSVKDTAEKSLEPLAEGKEEPVEAEEVAGAKEEVREATVKPDDEKAPVEDTSMKEKPTELEEAVVEVSSAKENATAEKEVVVPEKLTAAEKTDIEEKTAVAEEKAATQVPEEKMLSTPKTMESAEEVSLTENVAFASVENAAMMKKEVAEKQEKAEETSSIQQIKHDENQAETALKSEKKSEEKKSEDKFDTAKADSAVSANLKEAKASEEKEVAEKQEKAEETSSIQQIKHDENQAETSLKSEKKSEEKKSEDKFDTAKADSAVSANLKEAKASEEKEVTEVNEISEGKVVQKEVDTDKSSKTSPKTADESELDIDHLVQQAETILAESDSTKTEKNDLSFEEVLAKSVMEESVAEAASEMEKINRSKKRKLSKTKRRSQSLDSEEASSVKDSVEGAESESKEAGVSTKTVTETTESAVQKGGTSLQSAAKSKSVSFEEVVEISGADTVDSGAISMQASTSKVSVSKTKSSRVESHTKSVEGNVEVKSVKELKTSGKEKASESVIAAEASESASTTVRETRQLDRLMSMEDVKEILDVDTLKMNETREAIVEQKTASGRTQVLEVSARRVSKQLSLEEQVATATHQHHLHHPPEIIVPPQNQFVSLHSEIELTVKVRAAHGAKISWFHDGQEVAVTDKLLEDIFGEHYEMTDTEVPEKE